MKNRDFSLDIVRLLACFLVVLMHAPIPADNAPGSFLATLSYFTAPCIGIFFMVSGSLLLPVKTGYFTFLRHRLNKIVAPTLVWTAIYMGLDIYFGDAPKNLLQAVLSIPFCNQGNGILWFMYTLTGLYLLAPILSTWVQRATDREIEFVLLLWIISLCYPLLSFFVMLDTGSTGVLYYFSGYAGYFLLGYYLKHRTPHRLLLPAVIVGISGLMLMAVLKVAGVEYQFYSLFWYLSIFIVALCCVYWVIVQKIMSNIKIDEQIGRKLAEVSGASFGIYLMHILVMRYWLWKLPPILSIHIYPLQTLVVALLSLFVTAALCLLIARLPGASYIIGYKK